MKKIFTIAASLFLTITMQAQLRPQPKPGQAPKINIKKPETFKLSNGLTVLIVENHKLPRVAFNLTLDNAPYAEGNKKGVDDLTSALLGNGTSKISKDAYNDEIDFLGASINLYSSGASANGLTKYSGRVLELMAMGALDPNFTQVEFDKAKEKLIENLKNQEKNVQVVAGRVESVLAYGKNHPLGEYVSEESLKNVSLADVKSHYHTYFVPENAYLVVVGDVNPKQVKKQVEDLFGSWKKATAPKLTYNDPVNAQYTQIDFVDMPNAVQSEISLVNTYNLKMSDPDYFPVIVANQVLGGDFNSYLNMNLREAHGWTYGARSGMGVDKNVSSKFKANSQVRNMVTDSAVVEFVKEIKRLRTDAVDKKALDAVKAGYVGRFVMQIEKPQTIARYALNIKTEGLPENFYENYIKSINAVTPEDIKRVANKYILSDNTRIIVTGKGADVLPGLEKLGIPILYFDKYGNPTEKPAMNKPAPAGVTANSVLTNYIKAIGGDKAVNAVKTVSMAGTTTIPQAPGPLTFTSKTDSRGKLQVELLMGGMSMMKQIVNEKEAFQIQQGQKKAVEGDDYKEMKDAAVPFKELAMMKDSNVTLTGIEQINGSDAYAIKNGNGTTYYDVKSGLKVADAKTQDMGGKPVTLMTYYKDYRDVKGVKMPFNIIKNVGIELDIKIDDIKINERVTDADFK